MSSVSDIFCEVTKMFNISYLIKDGPYIYELHQHILLLVMFNINGVSDSIRFT